jgi:hypothetical protein
VIANFGWSTGDTYTRSMLEILPRFANRSVCASSAAVASEKGSSRRTHAQPSAKTRARRPMPRSASLAHALPQSASQYRCEGALIAFSVSPPLRWMASPQTPHATAALPPERPVTTGEAEEARNRREKGAVASTCAHHVCPPPRQQPTFGRKGGRDQFKRAVSAMRRDARKRRPCLPVRHHLPNRSHFQNALPHAA